MSHLTDAGSYVFTGERNMSLHTQGSRGRLAHACVKPTHVCRRRVGSGEGAGWMDTARHGAGLGFAGCERGLRGSALATGSSRVGSQPQGSEQGLPPQPHASSSTQHSGPRGQGRLVLLLSWLLGSPVPSTSWGQGHQRRDRMGNTTGLGSSQYTPVQLNTQSRNDTTMPITLLIPTQCTCPCRSASVFPSPTHSVHHPDTQMCADVV